MKENKSLQPRTSLRQKIILVLLGLSLFFVLLEVGLRLGGFILLSLQEYRNVLSIRHKGTYRILCIGESTTAGQYPPFLEEILNQHNIGIKFSVVDKGIYATTTLHILDRLESNLDAYHPDMVVTMMGINDRRLHTPYEAVSGSKAINFLKCFRIYKLTRLEELKSDKLSKYTPQPKFLLQRGEINQVYAEKKAIELNPRNDEAYVALGWLYRDQGKFSEAEASFKKAIELNPRDDWIYGALGCFYRDQGKISEAEASFKKVIELNPRNDEAYVALGWLYQSQGPGKFSEAEASLKKAIELNPRNDGAYVALGWLYQGQGPGKISEAEASLKKAIELNPRNDGIYGALEVLCIEKGNMGLASKYGKEARDLRLNYYALNTTSNYHKLKTILDKRGITYACVQYPMRNLEPLKKIFQGNDKGIIFVDNEKIFKNAVAKDGYQNYFRDMFSGDFGHCTDKGNRLLAGNIANVILKEVFHK